MQGLAPLKIAKILILPALRLSAARRAKRGGAIFGFIAKRRSYGFRGSTAPPPRDKIKLGRKAGGRLFPKSFGAPVPRRESFWPAAIAPDPKRMAIAELLQRLRPLRSRGGRREGLRGGWSADRVLRSTRAWAIRRRF